MACRQINIFFYKKQTEIDIVFVVARPNVVEGKLGVVDSVQSHLVPHVLHNHPINRLKVVITASDKHTMNSLVGTPRMVTNTHYLLFLLAMVRVNL